MTWIKARYAKGRVRYAPRLEVYLHPSPENPALQLGVISHHQAGLISLLTAERKMSLPLAVSLAGALAQKFGVRRIYVRVDSPKKACELE